MEVELIAMAGELKVPCVGDNAINECFYNMFGQGVNLAMKSLSSGNIVKHIVIYGINCSKLLWTLKVIPPSLS